MTVEQDIPPWMRDSGTGWVTAEYSMLPRSTHTRQRRERAGKPNSRAMELSRLIGRALRPAVDMRALGEITLRIDCDVIQADGGTRCASITGGWIALKLAESWMLSKGIARRPFVVEQVAAVSVGIKDGVAILDLDYEEDKDVDVDLNVVMAKKGPAIIELQGTAEHAPVTRAKLDEMMDLAEKGMAEIFEFQRQC